jgi:Sulfotransferase family
MRNLLSAKEFNELRSTPIIFIVGAGRSGTTLLQSLMDSHPNIVATQECLFIIALYPSFGKIRNWEKKDILKFIDALALLRIFILWPLDREVLTAELLAALEFADYPLLCKIVYYQMRKDKERISVLIDKNPLHSIFLKKVRTIFPEAKFIHLIREPRDNVNSNIMRFGSKNTFFLARKWIGFNARIESMKRKIPDRFFTVLYEDMVVNTENVFRALCEYLGVDYSDSMRSHKFPERLQGYEGAKFYERAKKIHQSLLEPINAANIGKWKYEMSEYDRIITEIIAANFAKKYYNYDMEAIKSSTFKISSISLFKSRIQYTLWELFTYLRFTNLAFNVYYRKKKKLFR